MIGNDFQYHEEDNLFANHTDNDKVIYILNPSTPTQANKLGSFIKKSMKLRTGYPLIFTRSCIYIERVT